ncbi:MAG: right-handed parallel beta-helix repeat-containing protein [Bacteroidota bacterium]|nr:T9SS type A sorting domain-containing protein [Ignavibacteria bacterium]MCU7514608.1 T9SS type A sorting domain-containing protein [Ignavibacteria bacterium]MCU7522350.1 T9SS type A sorting domain-containing protein [Ignavibacteria bacterium]MCU7526498.1 T9SS type A sorting domain-containing protein [Ignavibacteria bacterium]
MNGKNKVWVAPTEIYNPHEIRGCLTHELGHSIGLGHADYGAHETMSIYGVDWDPRILSYNDIVGASFVGGYLIRNESFSGPMYFDWPITIASGTTIYFNAGTTVYLQSGNSMTINGDLVVNGTPTNKINFQRNGTSGRWGNLIFDRYGVAGSTLSNVNLYNGNEIRVMNSAKVTISNCLLKDFYNGIYIYKATVLIDSNQIINPQQNGIYGEASGFYPVITHNTITKTNHSGQGIHLMNSTTGFIAHNDISGCDYGVYIGSATAFFSDKVWSMFYPNNKFTDNNTAMCAAWGGFLSAGQLNYNTAYNTIHPSRSYDAYAYQSGILVAQYNYWEGYNPKVYYDGTSSVSVANMLADDPWTTPYYGPEYAMANNSSISKTTLSKTTLTAPETDPVDLSAGVKLEKEGRLGDAITWYKTLVNSDKYQPFALSELMRIKNMYSKSDILSYMEGLSKVKKNSNLEKLLGDNYLQNGEFDKAVAWFDNAVSSSSSEQEALDAKFSKLFAYINVKKDMGIAQEILTDIKKGNVSDFYFSSRIETAENLMNDPSAYSANKDENLGKSVQSSENSIIVTDYSLSQNYPNPFNPTTTIRYSVPVSSNVKLMVYDMLGNEVASLVNEVKPAGSYEVRFDASSLPSGVYVYTIQTEHFRSSKKLLLMK